MRVLGAATPLFLDFSWLHVGFLRTRRSLNVRPNIPRAFSVSGGIREGVHSDLELYHALLHAHVNMSTSKREMWNDFSLVWSKTETKTAQGPIEVASIGPALFWLQFCFTRGDGPSVYWTRRRSRIQSRPFWDAYSSSHSFCRGGSCGWEARSRCRGV